MPTISPQVTPYYGGGQVVNPANVLTVVGAPSAAAYHNALGTIAVDHVNDNAYILVSVANATATWYLMGGASAGLTGITGDTGTATPSLGVIKMAGTANEITTAASGNTVTFTIPTAFIGPGTITSVGAMFAGTSFTAQNGITATTGNIAALAGNVSASGTVTGGTGVTATTGNIQATAGGLTAGAGDITATNGNLVLTAAGNKMVRTSVASTTTAGANSIGTVTLVGGTATVATTAVDAGSLIQLSRMSVGATGAAALGMLSVGTITAGVSFVINAWSATDATALATTDVSSILWEITN